MINLSDGSIVSVDQYIEKFVLPIFKDVEIIRLKNGKEVSLNVFINQYVLTHCINEYNCDFDKFYSDYVNDNVNKFFYNNNMSIDELSKMAEARVYDMNDINPIVSRYGIYKDPVYSEISISDIIGFVSGPDDYDKNSIANNLDLYFSRFDSKIMSYSNRANGMLNYSKNNIISELYDSFRVEPIVVVKLENGKALVSENGMHRYHVLKLFYLDELSKINSDSDMKSLVEKYTIPVKEEKIDILKTYCNYLLKLTGANFDLSIERNDNLEQTGNSVLTMNNNKKFLLTDGQLLQVVKANLEKINNQSKMFLDCYENIPSFNSYIDTYFPELILGKNESKGSRS